MDSPLSLDELRAAQVEQPADPHLALRLAEALVATPSLSDDDIVLTVDLASAALEGLAVDAPEMPAVVFVLTRALARAHAWAEVLDLVEACRGRYPRWTELFLVEAVARGSLGGPEHTRRMITALETCLALGDDVELPGTPGGGTTWPYFHLGGIAERAGDAESAKTLYARAVPLPEAEAALARLGPKRPFTLVVCIPGREFSGRFFDAWNAFTDRCRELGIRLVVSRAYDAVVYYARNKVAGGDVRRGPRQAPFGGEVDYDYMLWIDSDVVFRFEDFQRLLAHGVDVAAGLYLMADNTHFAAVEHMDEERFQREGRFEFLSPAKLAARQGLVPVDYCGFGFVLVRRGVFERLEYPWFRPIYMEMGACREFTSEDVGFCMLAKQAGVSILVDPKVVVGHEKAVVLAPPRAEAA